MKSYICKKKAAYLFIILLTIALLSVGCVMAPEARNEMRRLDTEVMKIFEESKKTAGQIQRIIERIEEIRALGASGKISGEQISEMLALALHEQTELKSHYEKLMEHGKAINESQQTLRDEYNVPWWHIALNSGLTILTILSTGGAIKLGGVAKGALNASRVLIRNIELGGTKEEIKKGVASASNTKINKMVADMYGK